MRQIDGNAFKVNKIIQKAFDAYHCSGRLNRGCQLIVLPNLRP